MSMSAWIRQGHRWLSIVFTLTVIANFAYRAAVSGEPPSWLTYSPLPPLLLLLFSGLYLFALPYTAKWRSRERCAIKPRSTPDLEC
ncbi:MAG: hypothetical protein HY066_01695 [Betaproteobacteria bacterium]|nr:hypothetical protein [Betaproteobacteria bacterium]